MYFAQNLAFLMNHYGLSNYQLAKQIGCHQTSVANWLSETTRPQKKMMKDLADAFGLTVEQLCDEQNPPAGKSLSFSAQKRVSGENAQKNPPAITGEGKRAWAKSVIDQISEDDFDSLAPLLRRFGDKYKED